MTNWPETKDLLVCTVNVLLPVPMVRLVALVALVVGAAAAAAAAAVAADDAVKVAEACVAISFARAFIHVKMAGISVLTLGTSHKW